MAWFTRSLRTVPPAEVSFTLFPNPPTSAAEEEFLQGWFAAFDERRLPVTWASIGLGGSWTLAQRMVDSTVPHELAYRVVGGSIQESLPLLENHGEIARQASLPLRSLVHDVAGIHPAVLTRLGVRAVVRLDPLAPQRQTGLVRSHGWDQWEVILSDLIPQSLGLTESTQLMARLYVAKRDDARLHFLWPLTKLSQPPRTPALRLLDCAADLARRNQIDLTTLGKVAETASQKSRARAA